MSDEKQGTQDPAPASPAEAPRGARRRGRRVTTAPVPGSDPTPAPLDRRVDTHDNDARLKADKPPHWG
ncbi:hypothetical protein GCM10025867_17060 [Frondihabitans sucicola]|uniref:Uncharacterized protein n=1 Tax=Frondihabitans sucicola TaxID=1268041 RepID=A0ABN6XWW6_9MICO|nr:hypothetical protein [Frondihabitans sucicola]BDZ49465.1 hypothetical protein GCM10025867_17060 [Frondihabitans sucicola]